MVTPGTTFEVWRERVEAELAGVPFAKLTAKTLDGIAIEPLYLTGPGEDTTGVPGMAPFVRGATAVRGWWIAQRTIAVDPAVANHELLADLAGGANAIRVVPPPAGEPQVWLDRALEDVVLDAIGIVIELDGDPRPWIRALDALAERRGHDPAALELVVGAAWLELGPGLGSAPLVELLRRPASGVYRLVTDEPWRVHAMAGTSAEQLGAAVAAIAELLREAEAGGVPPEHAAQRLGLRCAVGPDHFEGLAMLRAARRLWSLLLSACGIEPDTQPAPFLDVSTSPRTLARRDPWVNLLRASGECFAGICGGADALEVWPLDARLGSPSELGRRLARTTQVVLAEEGGVGRVLDPAGGSYFVETLTERLAEAGWAAAQRIEAEGGIRAGRSGIAARCAATWARERELLRVRRRPITGVSEYPQLNEHRVPGLQPGAPLLGREIRALASEFEALRDAAEALAARPRVYLVTLGALADHAVRLDFMRNLFAAGGIDIELDSGTLDLTSCEPEVLAREAGARYARSGLAAACVCGSDAAYTSHGAAIVAGLVAAGARPLLLAGRPRGLEPALRSAGVSGFVALGENVVALLADLLEALGATIPAEVGR